VAEFPTTQSANGVKIQRGKLREMALANLKASSTKISLNETYMRND